VDFISTTKLLYHNKGYCKVLGTVVVAPRRNCDNTLTSILGLDQNEAQLYLLVVYSGKMTVSKIAEACNWDAEKAKLYSTRLTEKGMFIEIEEDNFESLHPRFALSNRYRRRCNELGLEYGKNDKVDSLAAYLEKYYDLARTN
jgi:predicted transcriptional regulator